MKTVIGDRTGSAAVDTAGAQLVSLKNAEGREYLWQGDPKYWAGQAPILFPIIGSLRNNRAEVQGKSYEMLRHGIARHMEFERTAASNAAVSFLLKSTPETKERYPFDFEFTVAYRFENRMLSVGFTVKNTGSAEMPFAVGGHPAFNCPLEKDERFEDYDVIFAKKETASCPQQNPETRLLDFSDRVPVLQDQDVLPMDHKLFANDVLVFDRLHSDAVTLKSRKTGHGVRLGFAHFPFLGIWSAEGGAPFVALEPWTGCSTAPDEGDDLLQKRNMMHLNPGDSRSIGFTVTIL